MSTNHLLPAVLRILLPLLVLMSPFLVDAQHLDVQGNSRIRGNLDISHQDDLSSIHIGYLSGVNTNFDSNRRNTLVGYGSGLSNTNGHDNTFIGSGAGVNNTGGYNNTFCGSGAGSQNITGNRNTFVGDRAGLYFKGNRNICIGASAGPTNGSGNVSDRLYIDVKEALDPLIYGEFDNDLLQINGNLTVQDGQSVIRMNTNNASFGSVIVMRNTTNSSYHIGAINFEVFTNSAPGQIAYRTDNQMTFRVNGIEPFMTLLHSSGDHIRMDNGAKLTAGGVWTDNCSVTMKNLEFQVSGKTILQKLRKLPIYQWRYKENLGERHLGPVAEDFYEYFGLGESKKHIASLDLAGVGLAAIQALDKENSQLKNELEVQKLELKETQEMVQILEEELHKLSDLLKDLQIQMTNRP